MSPQRPEPSRFAVELRRLRLQAKFSLRDLAYRADLDPGYLSRLETGWQKRVRMYDETWQAARPSRRALDDIAETFNQAGIPPDKTDQLYRLLQLDPPRRVRETHDSDKQLRGLPTAGGNLDDLSPEDVKALLLDLASRINPEQDRGSGADRDGARGSGTAYGAAAG